MSFLLDQTRVPAIWRVWQRKQSAGASPKCVFQQRHVSVRTSTASRKVQRGEWKLIRGHPFREIQHSGLCSINFVDLCEQEVYLDIGLCCLVDTEAWLHPHLLYLLLCNLCLSFNVLSNCQFLLGITCSRKYSGCELNTQYKFVGWMNQWNQYFKVFVVNNFEKALLYPLLHSNFFCVTHTSLFILLLKIVFGDACELMNKEGIWFNIRLMIKS